VHFTDSAGMRWISDFFRAGGTGVDNEPVGKMTFVNHVLEDELGHGGTADVAVADE